MADMRLFKPDTVRCAEIWGTRDAREDRDVNFVGTSLGLLLIWSDGYIELQGESIYLGDGYRIFDDEEPYDWPEDWPPRKQVEASLLEQKIGDADLLGVTLSSEKLPELLGKHIEQLTDLFSELKSQL